MLHMDEQDKQLLFFILAPYKKYDIRAYGSRVKGTQHQFSDLDLCVMYSMPTEEYHDLIDALGNSNLPIFVSIVEWAKLSSSLKPLLEKDVLPMSAW